MGGKNEEGRKEGTKAEWMVGGRWGPLTHTHYVASRIFHFTRNGNTPWTPSTPDLTLFSSLHKQRISNIILFLIPIYFRHVLWTIKSIHVILPLRLGPTLHAVSCNGTEHPTFLRNPLWFLFFITQFLTRRRFYLLRLTGKWQSLWRRDRVHVIIL